MKVLAQRRIRRLRLALEWKAADAWVGVFVRRDGGYLHAWICLVPMLPLHVQFFGGNRPNEWPEPVHRLFDWLVES